MVQAGVDDFVDEVDDRRRRLVRLQFGEDVALIVRAAGRFLRDETEDSAETARD